MKKTLNKILIVCGSTAAGKTDLANWLSNIFDGVLISADSRQVYRGMNIGTGKDMERVGKIFGYDLADPKDDFNVSLYTKFARETIKNIWSQGKSPILIGGTGLYIKSVIDGIDTVNVPRNDKLRKGFEEKSVDDLFETLAGIDSVKAASMNASDRKNPRRLIRAIEIALSSSNFNSSSNIEVSFNNSFDCDPLYIGVNVPKEILNERIIVRVEKRIRDGIEQEIEKLLKNGVTWDMQSMYSIGYRQFKGYFEGEKTIDEVTHEWILEEQKYAKRQITWFKKNKHINWFDSSKKEYSKKVEELVKRWYSKHTNAKEN